MKKIIVGILFILLLSSCTSIPKYENGKALIILPVKTEKIKGKEFYIYYRIHYGLVSNDTYFPKEYIYFTPSSKKYIAFILPEGVYKITDIEPIRKSDSRKFATYSTNITFSCKDGIIRIIPTQLEVVLNKGIKGIVNQRISASPVEVELYNDIISELKNEDNFQYWNECE
jgi:hypothetical protein